MNNYDINRFLLDAFYEALGSVERLAYEDLNRLLLENEGVRDLPIVLDTAHIQRTHLLKAFNRVCRYLIPNGASCSLKTTGQGDILVAKLNEFARLHGTSLHTLTPAQVATYCNAVVCGIRDDINEETYRIVESTLPYGVLSPACAINDAVIDSLQRLHNVFYVTVQSKHCDYNDDNVQAIADKLLREFRKACEKVVDNGP